MPSVALSSGDVMVFDELDAPLAFSRKWTATVCGKYVYATANTKMVNGRFRPEYFHRMILRCKPGDGQVVDHINRNSLDCRRGNLRIVTHSENHANAGKIKMRHRKATSRYKGISWMPKISKWRSVIVRTHIGVFPTEEEAARAYDAAAKIRWGDCARTNAMICAEA